MCSHTHTYTHTRSHTHLDFPCLLFTTSSQVRGGASFALSTIWAFESPSHRKDMAEIWPGSTRAKEAGSDRMMGLLAAANKEMQAAGRGETEM